MQHEVADAGVKGVWSLRLVESFGVAFAKSRFQSREVAWSRKGRECDLMIRGQEVLRLERVECGLEISCGLQHLQAVRGDAAHP